MDDKQLEKMLSSLTAPEPSEKAKNQALEQAMTAFDEKMQKTSQGSEQTHRQTGINQTLNQVRRWIMKKRYMKPVGAVAACAVLAVLGVPFLHNSMQGSIQDGRGSVQGSMGNAQFADMSNNIVTASPGFCLFNCNKEPERVADARMLRMDESAALFADDKGGRKTQMAAAPQEEVRQKAVSDKDRAAVNEALVSRRQAAPEADRVRDNRIEGKEKADSYGGTKPAKKMEAQDAAVPMMAPAGTAGFVAEAEMIAPVPTSPPAMPDGASLLRNLPSPQPADVVVQQGYQDVGRDQFQKFEENSIKSVTAEPVSTFSIDVDTASYSFARKAINQGYLPQANTVRIEEMINYFDYNYAVPEAGGHPFQPTVAVYDSPWRSGTKLIHVGIKGYEVQKEVKSNLVFLIDTSGSMNSSDKLPLLVNSFKMMLENLSPDDTVGIVVYAGSAGTVLEPTKVADKHKIMQALERLSAGGSTAGAAGIQQAYALAEQSFIKDGNNRIILATDGDFNVGIRNNDELKTFVERKRDAGIALSVLGFGRGNYNDHLMQTLAQNGNGNAAYIDSLSEARKVLVEEAASTLFTIAKDVKVQVEFNPALVQEYRLIGYETRHLNREDFNNDKVDAGEIGAGHTVTAIYEITPVGAKPMVDDLRYQKPAPSVIEEKRVQAPVAEGKGDEYAFLKMRYKRPDENTSILMTRPITKADEKSFESLPDDLRFANAVAGFAQLLKGSKFVGNLSYDQVIEIANAARGQDEFGYRTEFVNLVRLAKSAAAMQNQR